ncbi:MAG TPA: PTS sugar transporter subunit IIA [Dissulfurispiraceae bacterium]|nr:PTS sugar transporter subunit IIA [Dissulfurispiraceae bacterium]
MNLSVKDVARLLNVSDKTIYRMIQHETIPCFRIGGQWRFDRREIVSWMEDTRTFAHKTDVNNTSGDEESISISEFLGRGGVYQEIAAATKDEAIRASLERIKRRVPDVDIKRLFASILEREILCPTAVGNGIALPHPSSFRQFTRFSYIALCRLQRPIPFGAIDNEDVDTLFFIFPKSERRFLRIQAKLLRLLRDEEVIAAIKQLHMSDDLYGGEILRVLAQKESQIFARVSP